MRGNSEHPLIVVGCGVAGLCVALSAAPRPVWLVGRAPAGTGGCTSLAQGGIAAALGAGDTPSDHAQDTLVAGAYHNDYDAVHYLVENAPLAVRWLQLQGVPFDLQGPDFLLAREGGHHRNRVVHAGGDASGASLLAALLRVAQQASHIRLLSPWQLEALRLDDHGITGVRLRGEDAQIEEIDCSSVVMATGGCGALFAASTNPSGADGNGLALALAAGANARDIEFMQFHPTALDVSVKGALPLITEALRGAGSRLYDDRNQRVMEGQHPLGDLAPRDRVARRVWELQREGQRIWLDATHLHDWMQYPTVYGICRQHGINPRLQRIPVTPAAHFHMGGIAVDLDGHTCVPGLFAVGEAACNGVHGANRLASNSLLEGVVYGRRLGRHLTHTPQRPNSKAARWIERGPDANAEQLHLLRQHTWRALGPVRDGETMGTTGQAIRQDHALARTWQAGLIQRMLTAAQQRHTSLGAHFRSDSIH